MLYSVFDVHRSGFKYWSIQDTAPALGQAGLEAEVKGYML